MIRERFLVGIILTFFIGWQFYWLWYKSNWFRVMDIKVEGVTGLRKKVVEDNLKKWLGVHFWQVDISKIQADNNLKWINDLKVLLIIPGLLKVKVVPRKIFAALKFFDSTEIVLIDEKGVIFDKWQGEEIDFLVEVSRKKWEEDKDKILKLVKKAKKVGEKELYINDNNCILFYGDTIRKAVVGVEYTDWKEKMLFSMKKKLIYAKKIDLRYKSNKLAFCN